MEYFNKKTIVSIEIFDECEEEIYRIYKKGTWKKKPFLFWKGEKWQEDVYHLCDRYGPHRVSTLEKEYHQVKRGDRFYNLACIHIEFTNQDYKNIYFNSNEERDKYLKTFDLNNYIII